ncbi:MAG: ABC transporter permease [Acidimicrobiales bacterium]
MSQQWWALVGLVARREAHERWQAKSFRISTAILVLAIAAGVVIPALLKGGKPVERVGVVGTNPASLTTTVTEAGRVVGANTRIVQLPNLPAGEAGLRSGSLAAVVVGGSQILVKQTPTQGDSSAMTRFVGALSQLGGLKSLFTRLPPATAAALAHQGVALPVHGLKAPPRNLTNRLTGLIAGILIYVLIQTYGIRIAIGVGEEKSTRVVEVLLSTLRPVQLLAGKVLGMGALVLAQVAAMVIAVVVAGIAVGSPVLHGTSAGVVGIAAMWFVIGYAFYCSAFAAAGSLVNRQADVYNIVFPILIPLILAYVLSYTAVFGSVNVLDRVLAFLPPTAPISMTVLYAAGAAPGWQVAVSAVICVAATVGVAKVAGVIYERAILRTGRRVRVKEVLLARVG